MNASELLEIGEKRLKRAVSRFSRVGDEYTQALELLEAVLGHDPDGDEEIPPAAQRRFEKLLERRATGEPIPHILGYTEFNGLRLGVRRGAFIPRATTEFMAQHAIKRLRRRPRPVHIDMATGVGAVALATAAAVPRARVFGVDLAREAVQQARKNARALAMRNVTFLCGDLFSPLPKALRGAVDVLTLHPPYVPKGDIRDLPAEIRLFEPIMSLTDRSSDGLGLLGMTVREAPEWIRPGGWMLVEVASDIARATKSTLQRGGFVDVRSTVGPLKWTRVIVGRLPAK